MEMKAIKFICLCLVVLLSSCDSMKYLPVSLDYTPNLTFKPGPTTILLTNNFDVSKLQNFTKRRQRSIKAGAVAAIKYAQNELQQLPNMKVINLVDTVDLKINTDSVKILALTNHADYVLQLNNFVPSIDLSELNNSFAAYTSTVQIDFTLFQDGGSSSKKLNAFLNEPHSEMPNMGLIGNLIFQPTVGGNMESVMKSAEHATKIALQDYLPYTITHNRPIYNENWIQPATNELLANNYAKADTLLRPFLKDSNNERAGKAAYQLAIVYEAQGRVEKAIKMVQIAIDKFKSNYALMLLDELKTE